MNFALRVVMGVSLVAVAGCTLYAEDDYEKLNSNLGVVASLPLSPTATYVHAGWGFTGGAGYNFSSHHAVLGEFMWNSLYATDGSLEPLRAALQARDFSGHSNLYALTGNYRFRVAR